MRASSVFRGMAAAVCGLVMMPAMAASTPAVADFTTCEKPVWPKEALRREQQGNVTLSFLIGEDGAVRDSRVVKSSGYPLLDTAALEGIMRCRFKPSTRDGTPVAAWMQMQYRWTLAGGNEAGYERARRAAENGDPNGQLRLAVFQLTPGPRLDVDAGLGTLRRMAKNGNPAAQEMLGLVLLQGRFVVPDAQEARTLLAAAAEGKRASAAWMLSSMLAAGLGGPRDMAASDKWLRRAAELGHAGAQTKLGTMLTWEPATAPEGVALLRQAVEQKDRQGQAALGLCYETGRGVERDYAQAAALYRLGAAAGSPDAKRGLARLHEGGNGVERDAEAARRLFEEADRAGGVTL